jgi:hypothetical protein
MLHLLVIFVLVPAGACNDTATRPATVSSPAERPSHVDSLPGRRLAPPGRTGSLIDFLYSCEPVAGCPLVVGAIPGFYNGYAQPAPVRFNFTGPVRQINLVGQGHISCSGSLGTLTGYDTAGKALGSVDLELIDPSDCSTPSAPDNVTFGAQAGLETKEVMAYAILTPMSLLEYPVLTSHDRALQTWSVSVGPGGPAPLNVDVVAANGPNEQGSFTRARAERKIQLEARVTPADPLASVTWEIADAPDDAVAAIPPTTMPAGVSTSFDLPRHEKSRWPTDHPGALNRKPLRYQVTAIARREGQTARSTPVIVGQDLVDTIREEYLEFGLDTLGRHVPRRGEFRASPPVSVGANNGDYTLAVLEPSFMAKLEVLKNSWNKKWQLNTIYRNPVHNLNGHIRSRSKPSLVSWHMWGCAADLQTFPQDGSAEQYKFWHELDALARKQGWDTESLEQAKVGHVHVELDCP